MSGDLYENMGTGELYIVLNKRDNNSWSVYRISDCKTTWVWEEYLFDTAFYVRLA